MSLKTLKYHSQKSTIFAELAGKPATFKVTVHEIKTKELPELNDEFAKEADEAVATLDELKAKLRTNLEESKKHEAEHKVRDEVVELVTLTLKSTFQKL